MSSTAEEHIKFKEILATIYRKTIEFLNKCEFAKKYDISKFSSMKCELYNSVPTEVLSLGVMKNINPGIQDYRNPTDFVEIKLSDHIDELVEPKSSITHKRVTNLSVLKENVVVIPLINFQLLMTENHTELLMITNSAIIDSTLGG